MNPTPIEDKRSFSRVPNKASIEVCRLSFPVNIKTEGIGKGIDIGAGGICFVYPEPFQPGQVLALKIDLRGWEAHKRPHSMFVDMASERPFTAIGEIVWSHASETGDGFEMGMKFTGVDEDDRKALIRYLSTASAAGQ